MEYLLFKNSIDTNRSFTQDETIQIRVFKPRLWKLFSGYCYDRRDFRTYLFRFYITFLTMGRTEVYFAENMQGELLHSAYVIPRNWKYAFLDPGEWCIGPCNTPEKYRGHGYYPYVISYILTSNPERNYSMFVRHDNISSQRGILKAGFVLSEGKVTGSRYLNRFIKSSEDGVNNNE